MLAFTTGEHALRPSDLLENLKWSHSLRAVIVRYRFFNFRYLYVYFITPRRQRCSFRFTESPARSLSLTFSPFLLVQIHRFKYRSCLTSYIQMKRLSSLGEFSPTRPSSFILNTTVHSLSLDEETLVDEGHHNVPYDATDVPLLLSANDAPHQHEVEAAVYDHADLDRNDHLARFYNAPLLPLSFTALRRLWSNKNAKGAIRLLSTRHRLQIDDHLTVDSTHDDVAPIVGPHFLDFVMYVGDRRGLDAVLPNDRVDHTWRLNLTFSGIYKLWPDSKSTRLPFDHHGRMMFIGSRMEEHVWISMVPNEWLIPDHPFNATGIWPKLAASPTSAMSTKHAHMMVMFFSRMFHDMLLTDFSCREDYPEVLTRRNVNDATDIL